MKNSFALIFAVVLMITLTACAGESNSSTPSTSNPTAQQEETPDTSAATITPAESSPEPSASPSSDGPDETDEEAVDILVAYFSWSGNTRNFASMIQERMGSDIFEIATVNDYSSDYNTVLDEAQAGQNADARPELNAQVDNMDEYDIVFIGYPNWWGDMPMALYSFLDEYDLSGKTVIPFCTHGGSGFSGTVSSIESAEPDAAVLDGLAIRDSNVDNADEDITDWLASLGITE